MKIIYIMGKSATGKDTILKEIIKQTNMKRYIPYTTRPKRKKEVDNVDYFFIDDENISDFKKQGKIIESRTYNTVSEKPWTYLTILDDQLTSNENLITIGTLESLGTFSKYILENDLDIKIIPIYIKVYPLIRFIRIIKNERGCVKIKKQLISLINLNICRKI